MEIDTIYNMDCLEGMKMIPDGSVDCIVTDPPYIVIQPGRGAGAFGPNTRKFHEQLNDIADGISDAFLDEMVRVCKLPNIYMFCSKEQLPQFLNYAVSHGLSFDVLTWHKTNPVPTCYNKYLSDTEYIVFMRKKAPLLGTYETKKKWFLTEVNKEDKELWGHPTCKPVHIVETFIINSSNEGDTILDPFMGSGTTAIAAIREKRHFIGFELNAEYYEKAMKRIKSERQQLTLF